MNEFSGLDSLLQHVDDKILLYRTRLEYLRKQLLHSHKVKMGTAEMAGVEVEVAGEKVWLLNLIHKLLIQQCMGNLMQ